MLRKQENRIMIDSQQEIPAALAPQSHPKDLFRTTFRFCQLPQARGFAVQPPAFAGQVPRLKKEISMSLLHRRHFPVQHTGSALVCLVLLVSLLLPTLEMAKVEAKDSTPPPPLP